MKKDIPDDTIFNNINSSGRTFVFKNVEYAKFSIFYVLVPCLVLMIVPPTIIYRYAVDTNTGAIVASILFLVIILNATFGWFYPWHWVGIDIEEWGISIYKKGEKTDVKWSEFTQYHIRSSEFAARFQIKRHNQPSIRIWVMESSAERDKFYKFAKRLQQELDIKAKNLQPTFRQRHWKRIAQLIILFGIIITFGVVFYAWQYQYYPAFAAAVLGLWVFIGYCLVVLELGRD